MPHDRQHIEQPDGHLAQGSRVGLELLADDGSIRGRQGVGAVGQHLGSDLGAQALDVTCSKAQRSIAISGWRRHPVSDSEVTDGGGGVAVADLSREESKRLRAELAEGLGFYPASLAHEDVARYREQIAEREAREEAGERDGWGPGGYRWRQWDHLREEKRRAEVEARGRAGVADLYEDL